MPVFAAGAARSVAGAAVAVGGGGAGVGVAGWVAVGSALEPRAGTAAAGADVAGVGALAGETPDDAVDPAAAARPSAVTFGSGLARVSSRVHRMSTTMEHTLTATEMPIANIHPRCPRQMGARPRSAAGWLLLEG